jgi:hypothetical protein
MHAEPVIANNVVATFREAKVHLKRTLDRVGTTRVALWGCSETGEVVMQLLTSAGVPVAAVYDSVKRGSFAGQTIRDPYKELDPTLPVIIASARPPEDLREVSGYLTGRGVPYFFTTSSRTEETPLAKFRGIHRGQRCFVVGNGPSLNQIDMTRLRSEITFGSNRVYHGFAQWGFHFRYWSIEDPLVAEDIRLEWNRMTGPTKFIPTDLLKHVQNREQVVEVPFLRKQFGDGLPMFSDDPAQMYWGGTVTYLLLELAVMMGCNPIYLVGVDCHYVRPDHVKELAHPNQWLSQGDDPNHFFPQYFGKGRKWHNPNVERMVKCYEAAHAYCRSHGVTVLNATPGSKLNVFDRVDFKSLFS